MAPQAWVVAENGEDLQGPREFLPLSKLEEVGVLYWHLDPKKSESEEELAKIRKDRGYSYMDLIEICPDKLENYEEKVNNFFTEHMHPDEEIRYCLEGSGLFDVRDKDDKWIRIWIKEGDMIVLPAGIYHRFTLDSAKYTKLMRLFIGVPVWTAFNRPQEDHPARQEYVKNKRSMAKPIKSTSLEVSGMAKLIKSTSLKMLNSVKPESVQINLVKRRISPRTRKERGAKSILRSQKLC